MTGIHPDAAPRAQRQGCIVRVRPKSAETLLRIALACFASAYLFVFSIQAACATPEMVNVRVGNAPGAELSLLYDYNYRSAAKEPTEVYVSRNQDSLQITFVAHQREQILASQQASGPAVQSDDYVGVFLWPRGTQGFQYFFAANPKGSTYQTSSENADYAPQWTATGRETASGYVVTLKIPLGVIRSAGSDSWRAQFVRSTALTHGLSVWFYSPVAGSVADPSFSGTLTDMRVQAPRVRARAQIYSLAEMTGKQYGGNTSRVGIDFSVPISGTVSVVGTVHPDYSNVDSDQQTITPNAFSNQYQEVRPFFAQVAQPFNASLNTFNTPTFLYTPSIPTFRDGLAVEGSEGPLRFSAFNVSGDKRNDTGIALDFKRKDAVNEFDLNLQQINVTDGARGLKDALTTLSAGFQHVHSFVYLNAAMERRSNVSKPSLGNYLEAGGGYASATSLAVLAYQKIGPQFSPADSYTAQPDVAGLEAYVQKQINFAASAPVQDISGSVYAARFADHLGRPAQENSGGQLTVDLKHLLSFRLFSNELSVRTATNEFLPFNNGGIQLGYGLQTANPSSIQLARGRYYHGLLSTMSATGTFPLRKNLRLRLELDRNAYTTSYSGEMNVVQSLERASLEFQINHSSALDIGLRRIAGRSVPDAYQTPTFAPMRSTNLSAAYHCLLGQNEFYLVYGDPNSVSTTPAIILKWVRYIGAAKGT
jgi:hypothetical protein